MKKFFYRVKDGEGLFSISEKLSVPPTLLIKENSLTKEVYDGQLLIVSGFNGKTYRVKPIDTIKSISSKFNVLPEKILIANGIDYIFYGLTIIIPE